eukprot:g33614.t1
MAVEKIPLLFNGFGLLGHRDLPTPRPAQPEQAPLEPLPRQQKRSLPQGLLPRQENITSLRLFKAWDATWSERYDRAQSWMALKHYIVSRGAKVLYGTQISCNETADDTDWLFVKELMIYIGREHVMGVAVGNEVELLHTQQTCSKKCAEDMFQGGYFYTKVMHRANDLQVMNGFEDVTLTTVMGGFSSDNEFL